MERATSALSIGQLIGAQDNLQGHCLVPAMRRLLLVLFCLAISLVASAQTGPLTLKSGDAVKVVVLGFPEYTADYFVLSDGSITGVGFGRLKAQGRTIEAVQAEITQRVKRYIKNPQVALVLMKERQQAVFLVRIDPESTGSAAVPGTSGGFPYVPGMELRQILALSTPPQTPDLYETKIYRAGKLFREVDLQGLLAGEPAAWNGPLQPDDLITLMPVPQVRVWILGQVARPGEYKVRKDLDIYQAIGKAGGFLDARLTPDLEIVVKRGPQNLSYPADQSNSSKRMMLEGNDTVVVQSALVKVQVAGDVMKPGEYMVRPGTTLAAAVGSIAGGASELGTLKGALIFRDGEVLVADATAPQPGTPPFLIQAGDSIFVQPNERFVTVLGEVNKPGRVMLREDQKVFLADALALAGGLTQRGSLLRAYVMSPVAGKMSVKQYNLDEWLKSGKAEANPELHPGDAVLFGQPKGITLESVSRVLSSALLLENLMRRM